MSLQGKVAIVTGAASGIGAQIARRFCAAGAATMLLDRHGDGLAGVADEIRASGGEAASRVTDISVGSEVEAAYAATAERFGTPGIVVNNAGWCHEIGDMAGLDEESFDRVMSVNVKSLFWSVRYGVPLMQRLGGGVILNIASTGAARPRPGLGWYNASKGAVVSATRSLALELAPDRIRVCAINPTTADTPMVAHLLTGQPAKLAAMTAMIPLGRLCAPQDVAEAALFLASDAAAFLTGVCLDVDGGRSI
jgi:3-oxoacyl-[acyl-carrier protein] reductase